MLRIRSFDNEQEPGPENDIITDYLTIRGVNPNIILNCSFTVTLSNDLTELSYSVDDGPWITTTSLVRGSTITAPPGNKIKWRGVGTCVSSADHFKEVFIVDLPFVVQGSLLSLIQKYLITAPGAFSFLFYRQTLLYSQFSDSKGNIIDAEITFPTNVTSYCYYNMFYGCSNMERVPTVLLPATVLADRCYALMFGNCTSLVTAPQLPATELKDYCYHYMFGNCTSLVTAPQLPATTLATDCYMSMFKGCASLTSAPQLPATTLKDYCYHYMFQDCTSLTTAPELPATTLAERCYDNMFVGCASLVNAPSILPATTLKDYCYAYMFYRCTSLVTAPKLPATALAPRCYVYMFGNCTSLVTAPQLPATTLKDYCYAFMFDSCTSLVTAPQLPATTLARGCYSAMFWYCSIKSLASFSLPATTLAPYCYEDMFFGMESLLTFIPAGLLPATTLAEGCYLNMFNNAFASSVGTFYCDRLPATTLAERCYSGMFARNRILYIEGILPATTLAPYCYELMFDNCALKTIPAGLLPATTLAEGCYYGMFEASRRNDNTTNLLVLPATTLAPDCYCRMFYGYYYEVNGTNAAYYCTINKLTFHGTIPDNTYAKDMLGLVRYSGTVYYKASVDSDTSKMSGWLPSNWSTSAI